MAIQGYSEQTLLPISKNNPPGLPVSQLKSEYESIKALYSLQPAQVQRFMEVQASQIGQAIVQTAAVPNRQAQFRFQFPDRIILERNRTGDLETVTLSADDREQIVGGLVERLAHIDSRVLLRQRLFELELSSETGLAAAARLVRFTTARRLIESMLPAGRSVTYVAQDREDIPSIPVDNGKQILSAITSNSDAIALGEDEPAIGRGTLQTPYAPAAHRFYLPQWVPFDEKEHLLVSSLQEAEAQIASMQNYIEILHTAVALAPYMVANPIYQQKRSGMLGQLVNQGRTYAAYQTNYIIQRIKQRAASQELNRGLSLSLPYFDDQVLQIHLHDFEIIPAGRVMFAKVFVTRAVRLEQGKVAQDTRLSPSTRKYLLAGLERLEKAFA